MHKIDNKKFGKLLLDLRTEKGLTQKQLAEQLYVSDKAISKWERGLCFPDTSLLLPLCEILNISATELLSGTRFEESRPISLGHSNQLLKTVISLKEKNYFTIDILQQKESLKKTICKVLIFTAISIVLNLLLIFSLYGVILGKFVWVKIDQIGLLTANTVLILLTYNLVSFLLFLYASFKKSICYLFSSLTYFISGSFLLWLRNFLRQMHEPDSGLLKIQSGTIAYLLVVAVNIGVIVYGFYRYRQYREK